MKILSCDFGSDASTDLRKLVKDLPGAAIGLNNEMIGGPSTFLATGKLICYIIL